MNLQYEFKPMQFGSPFIQSKLLLSYHKSIYMHSRESNSVNTGKQITGDMNLDMSSYGVDFYSYVILFRILNSTISSQGEHILNN